MIHDKPIGNRKPLLPEGRLPYARKSFDGGRRLMSRWKDMGFMPQYRTKGGE